MVKAKVTAVKAKQRLRGAEEVVDLLEQSINGAATVATPNKKEAPKNEKKMQDKFKKSIANLKGLEQEIKKRTTRLVFIQIMYLNLVEFNKIRQIILVVGTSKL